MKETKFKEELQQMTKDQLSERVRELREALFRLRLNKMTAHIKDYSQFKKLRRDIARTLTVLHEKEQQA